MRVSDIGGSSYNPKINLDIPYHSPEIMQRLANKASPVIGEINEGPLKREEPVGEWKPVYKYLVGYSSYLTGSDFRADSMEDIFGRALDLYDRIKNSSDDEETRNAKYAALDEAVKGEAMRFAIERSIEAYAEAYLKEVQKNNKTVAPEVGAAFNELQKGLAKSAKDLASQFIDLVRTQQITSYADVVKMLQEETGNSGYQSAGLQNLSDLSKRIGKMIQGNLDAVSDKAGELVNPVNSKTVDEEFEQMWADAKAASGIYDQYGRV
jgi:hypothetical protein